MKYHVICKTALAARHSIDVLPDPVVASPMTQTVCCDVRSAKRLPRTMWQQISPRQKLTLTQIYSHTLNGPGSIAHIPFCPLHPLLSPPLHKSLLPWQRHVPGCVAGNVLRHHTVGDERYDKEQGTGMWEGGGGAEGCRESAVWEKSKARSVESEGAPRRTGA